jgi:hypothetical protein
MVLYVLLLLPLNFVVSKGSTKTEQLVAGAFDDMQRTEKAGKAYY